MVGRMEKGPAGFASLYPPYDVATSSGHMIGGIRFALPALCVVT